MTSAHLFTYHLNQLGVTDLVVHGGEVSSTKCMQHCPIKGERQAAIIDIPKSEHTDLQRADGTTNRMFETMESL